MIHRLDAVPISLHGESFLLTRPPFCWCGKPMVGTAPMFNDGWPFDWSCDDHGNADLTVQYIVNRASGLVTAIAGWESHNELHGGGAERSGT